MKNRASVLKIKIKEKNGSRDYYNIYLTHLTSDISQKLYENGHITYIRTDSTFISEEFQTQLQRKVQMDYGDGYYQKSKEKRKI